MKPIFSGTHFGKCWSIGRDSGQEGKDLSVALSLYVCLWANFTSCMSVFLSIKGEKMPVCLTETVMNITA